MARSVRVGLPVSTIQWNWPVGRRVLERFENMLVMEVDGIREIPDNVTIPERVLDRLELDITVYGVESEE